MHKGGQGFQHCTVTGRAGSQACTQRWQLARMLSAGVWLLARCADLEGLGYDVRRFGFCLLALFGLGMIYRVAALAAMLLLYRDRQR